MVDIKGLSKTQFAGTRGEPTRREEQPVESHPLCCQPGQSSWAQRPHAHEYTGLWARVMWKQSQLKKVLFKLSITCPSIKSHTELRCFNILQKPPDFQSNLEAAGAARCCDAAWGMKSQRVFAVDCSPSMLGTTPSRESVPLTLSPRGSDTALYSSELWPRALSSLVLSRKKLFPLKGLLPNLNSFILIQAMLQLKYTIITSSSGVGGEAGAASQTWQWHVLRRLTVLQINPGSKNCTAVQSKSLQEEQKKQQETNIRICSAKVSAEFKCASLSNMDVRRHELPPLWGVGGLIFKEDRFESPFPPGQLK